MGQYDAKYWEKRNMKGLAIQEFWNEKFNVDMVGELK